MEKLSFRGGALLEGLQGLAGNKVVKGLGIGAAGAAAGGLGGYAMGKRRHEMVAQPIGGPQGNEMGAFMGPRHAVQELAEDIQDLQGGEPEAQDFYSALQDAEGSGVYFKGAAADEGRLRARAFARHIAKLGADCAHGLLEKGWLSKEAAAPFFSGVYDLQKCAQLFKTVGVAAALTDGVG